MTKTQMELLLAYARTSGERYIPPSCVGIPRNLTRSAGALHRMGFLASNGRGSYLITVQGRDAAQEVQAHLGYVSDRERARALLIACRESISTATQKVQATGAYPTKAMTDLARTIQDFLSET